MEESTISKILKFRDDRNWKQFHNPKDMAISISIEAAELLENFQWSGAEVDATTKIDNIKEELADVMIYCIMMADTLNVDMNEIIKDKLLKNESKYQIDKSYGNSKKYSELEG